MKKTDGKKILLYFNVSAVRILFIMGILLVPAVLSPNPCVWSQERPGLGNQINIFEGIYDQRFWINYPSESCVAFDSINKRFLVVWFEWPTIDNSSDIYGQLVNADGSLYGDIIPICITDFDEQAFNPMPVFDSSNGRFLVAWSDSRDIPPYGAGWRPFGQFINSDGTLSGNNFPILPPDEGGYFNQAAFDSINNRYFITYSCNWIYFENVYCRFMNADGSFPGGPIQITDYTEYFGGGLSVVSFDRNNQRFLIAHPYSDGQTHGQIINSDGTFYGGDFQISITGGRPRGIAFDATNNRFFVLYVREDSTDGDAKAQLVNADGTLFGNEINIGNIHVKAVFDSVNEKFLVIDAGPGVIGKYLYTDGTQYYSDFRIPDVDGLGLSNLYGISAAFGNGEIGSLVAWEAFSSNPDYGLDIFGKFVKLVPSDDADADGIPALVDNCPNKANGPELGTCSPSSDKAGASCSSDADCVIGCSSNGQCQKNQEDTDILNYSWIVSDRYGDVCDNCPSVYNLDQADADNDGGGDFCDSCPHDPNNDADSDGRCADVDNCPTNCNSNQLDADGDGIGDVCDPTPGCGGCSGIECEQQC